MKLYHRTDHADEILRDGFLDVEDNYMTRNLYRGVWFSDSPLDENEGVTGLTVLEVDAGAEDLDEWEWVEEHKGYREWLIPAEVANTWPAHPFDLDSAPIVHRDAL
ncbi:hypothetical protein BH18ACT5_BH18ACT5_06190 [soil metagenome]